MANPPNYRLGRRATPPGKINTLRGQVNYWRPLGEPPPLDPNYFPSDYTSDTDYVEGEL